MDFEQRQRRVVGVNSPDLRQKPADQGLRTTSATGPRLASREFRKNRGSNLLNSVAQLDAALDEQACRQLAEAIASEYSKEYGGVIPLGFLATCRLGPPYVDHRLSLMETIVEHYSPSDRVPTPFSEARSLVRTGAYLYVEIYSDGQLVPVRNDGSIATL